MFTPLLRILDDVDVLGVLAITAEVAKAVPERCAQTLEDRWQEEPVRPAHRGRGHIDNLFWLHGH